MKRFVSTLWRAFPRARSEHELSELVADHLSREGRKVSPRAVRNWLGLIGTPHYRYVTRILALLDDTTIAAVVRGRLH